MQMQRMSRANLVDLNKALALAGSVVKHETDCDEDYRRFKYVCGKNFNTLHKLEKEFAKEIQDILSPSEEYVELTLKRDAICQEYAVIGDDGKPAVNEGGEYEFPVNLDRSEMDARIDQLATENEELVNEQVKSEELVDVYMNEEVSFALHQFDFEKTPARISGSFIDAMSVMFTNVPELD